MTAQGEAVRIFPRLGSYAPLVLRISPERPSGVRGFASMGFVSVIIVSALFALGLPLVS